MPDAPGRPLPPPLVAAASLAAVEGLLLLGYGVLEGASIRAERAAMGVTSALLFVLLGVALVGCAGLVSRGRPWARSPLVVAQVIFLGLAWDFRGGATTWVAVTIALVAAIVLGGLLHPASVDALSDRGSGDGAR